MNHPIVDFICNALKLLLAVIILRMILPALGFNIKVPLLDPMIAWSVRWIRIFISWISEVWAGLNFGL